MTASRAALRGAGLAGAGTLTGAAVELDIKLPDHHEVIEYAAPPAVAHGYLTDSLSFHAKHVGCLIEGKPTRIDQTFNRLHAWSILDFHG